MLAFDADDDRRDLTPTPWGPAERQRERQLPPGPGRRSWVVAREQRERLFAATVAVVAERGYEATRVADIIELAGVSRSAFYEHFADKRHCFAVTLGELLDLGRATVADAYRACDGPADERLRAGFDAAIALIVAQPAAARLCFVEAYAAGPEAVELVESVADGLVRVAGQTLRDSPERAAMPRDLSRAVLGGVRRVIEARLRQRRERELPKLAPDLIAWALAYRPPPEPLRRPTAPTEPAPTGPDGQRERIMAAIAEIVAEKGYAEMAIAEIAERAAISLSTFYARYPGKEEAFAATLEHGDRRLVEHAAAAYAAAGDPPRSARAAIRATFAFLDANPTLARLTGYGAYSAGAAAIERHERALAPLQPLLRGRRAGRSRADRIAGEAVAGSLWALLSQRLRLSGPTRLYALAPAATYLALAPLVGPTDACRLANEPA